MKAQQVVPCLFEPLMFQWQMQDVKQLARKQLLRNLCKPGAKVEMEPTWKHLIKTTREEMQTLQPQITFSTSQRVNMKQSFIKS